MNLSLPLSFCVSFCGVCVCVYIYGVSGKMAKVMFEGKDRRKSKVEKGKREK